MTADDSRALVVREARTTDRPVVDTLQSLLASPAPDLTSIAFDGPGTVLVAEQDDVVGYVLALPSRDPSDPCLPSEAQERPPDSKRVATPASVDEQDHAEVYIAELVVAPDARRQGIGSRLVDGLAARFPGHEQLRLTARIGDDRALGFYRDAGFRRLRELPDHYGDAHGVLLARDIGE